MFVSGLARISRAETCFFYWVFVFREHLLLLHRHMYSETGGIRE
jgi:hypothetical protein